MRPAYFVLEPEDAGGLGPGTVLDRSAHPPIVSKLHYEFEGWLGDEIVEGFPCFLVTERLADLIREEGLSGATFDAASVTRSVTFDELQAETELRRFVWLKPTGRAGVDDFGLAADARLVVSARALSLIRSTGPTGLDVAAYDA